MLKENRSLLMCIILTIVTLGLYGLYFTYAYARDMNIACAGDGKHTAGLIKLILLSVITLGIYGIIWYYKVGDRIYENCIRKGMVSPCTGGSLLCWSIFGSLIYIGPFVAMYKMIKGLNMLCAAYNRGQNNGGFSGNITVNVNTGR